jgi:hypothetical protein
VGEWRAAQALEGVAGVYESNVVPYIAQFENLKDRQVIKGIAWREDRATKHVIECHPEWFEEAPAPSQVCGQQTTTVWWAVWMTSRSDTRTRADGLHDRRLSAEKRRGRRPAAQWHGTCESSP